MYSRAGQVCAKFFPLGTRHSDGAGQARPWAAAVNREGPAIFHALEVESGDGVFGKQFCSPTKGGTTARFASRPAAGQGRTAR